MQKDELCTDCTKCKHLQKGDLIMGYPVISCAAWGKNLTYQNEFKIISRCLSNEKEMNKFEPKTSPVDLYDISVGSALLGGNDDYSMFG